MSKRANPTGKGFAKSSKFYVVLRPDTEEFLVKFQETIFGSAAVWSKHPQSAQSSNNFDDVRSVAKYLSMSKAIEIHVCSVLDNGQQYKVETESRFFPHWSGLTE